MTASAKAFYADLACVGKSEFEHVSAIRRGDSDGEITFKYSNTSVGEPLEIQVVATDLYSYPYGTSFMIFTSSDTCSTSIVKCLEQLSTTTQGCSLQSVIEAISNRLGSRLDETQPGAEPNYTGEDEDECDEGDDTDLDIDEFEPIDGVDDEYFEVQAISRPTFDAETPISQDIDGLQRIQRELKASRLAGFAVGIYSLVEECPVGIVSLSIPVSKLILPSAAISAWGLEATDYLVLLVKFLAPYPDLETMLSATPGSEPVVFRFGKCKSPKPSIQCAMMAFRPVLNTNDEPDVETEPAPRPENNSVQPSEEQDKLNFNSIYMSNTIDDLLNRSFSKLLKIRLDHRCSWDMAQALLDQFEGRNEHNERVSENTNRGVHSSKTSSSIHGPSSSYYDDGMKVQCEENSGFMVVAMRFSLRRLCKCTEYCMICHQRLGNDVETLKPYVCSKSLCLYQYLSLAFGTSLETEIVNSPYVVDLLISLFYSSLTTGCLREFPRGLALKVPLIKKSQENVKIEFCQTLKEFRVPNSETKLGDGDWVLVLTKSLEEEDKCPEEGWLPAIVLPFSHDPDDMDKIARGMSLQQLLDAMPSVLEMRKFLLEAPGRNLGGWTRMNRSALSLVRWIVASNTSYIVQDSAVPVFPGTKTDGSRQSVDQKSSKSSTESGMIKGLGSSWMQFRFAQGSPDKESAFAKAVKTLCNTHPSKTVNPTLFAWHGSALGNWHSIIRTGLDFSRISNGRSFGQGVYLSKNMGVSKRYADKGGLTIASTIAYHNSPWPKSDLRPKSALSICEIVNCPDEFVSTNPHFVINKTEWIQCRYLLLQVDPTEDAMRNPVFSVSPCLQKDYIRQDPNNEITGERGQPLEIPRTATSSFVESRKRGYRVQQVREDGDDPEALTETIQAMMTALPHGRKRSHSMTSSEGVGERASVQTHHIAQEENEAGARGPVANPQRIEAFGPFSTSSVDVQQQFPKAPTAFNVPTSSKSPLTFLPGTTDLTTLPQLPEPAWAVSSRMALQALSREIRQLHQTQSQNDAASLGWYFDTAKVSNLFQWIVELHTFDADLPLAKDMMRRGHTSVVLEIRFGSNFPMSPPFVRVIRPRFLPFQRGGGGHVTAGGAICSEMLTGSGWSPAMSMENVFLQIRLGLCDTGRPARLDTGRLVGQDYGIGEAVEAYMRAARTHGWVVPQDVKTIDMGWKQD
ncbi:hypothetical protein E4U43_004404 [Claviceps pusilla]|uniref:UBC core domain-containing protein n=1 Tax=Claviceps pusilla TaxID=123648 RepID=A0A9P7NGZ6_9HYPO|nr:hypothetical protein E4U43_004404 [Claviceps pusilla]